MRETICQQCEYWSRKDSVYGLCTRYRCATIQDDRCIGSTKVNDNVNHPAHYEGRIECIDAIEVATEGLAGIEAVCTGNALKYIWRWKKKNGIEDLKKAVWYINHLIETAER